jgi:hypothetical protein
MGKDAKYQTLANLANFAYDPINYEWLEQLGVVDLFLGSISLNVLDTRNKTDKYSFNNFLQYLKPGIYNNFR